MKGSGCAKALGQDGAQSAEEHRGALWLKQEWGAQGWSARRGPWGQWEALSFDLRTVEVMEGWGQKRGDLVQVVAGPLWCLL